MKLPHKLILSTALAVTAFTGTVAARDVFAPAPPPPPFLRGIERVGLNDTQRLQIEGILDADREANDKLRDNAREAREAFVSITPGSSGYQSAAEKFADAESRAVRARILGEAQVRAKVYAALTEAQRVELASLPKPPEPGIGPGFGPERSGPERGPRGMGHEGPERGPGPGLDHGPDADGPPPPAGR
jgi:Spy/CpxP family protein refolding chaperone